MKNLAATPDLSEIRSRIAALTAADQARWGQMNVGQMTCHVTDAFRLSMGEQTATPKTFPIPLGLLKWFSLQSPFPWPKGAPTPPEIKHDTGGTRPGEFRDDLLRLLQYLDTFAGHKGDWPPHPFFGSLTEAEWMRWGYLHCDHHLRQFGR